MNNISARLHHIMSVLKTLVHNLSFRERIIFIILCITLIIASFGALFTLNYSLTTKIPVAGGSYTEAIVGTPRFINPLLATSGPDQDLVEIVYAGLMTFDGTSYIPELADRYKVSDDGLVYTFTLKDKLKFHDGKSLTAYDVAFTVELVQNSAVKSPLRSEWFDVQVDVLDEKTIQFTLENPYAGFLDVTTLGILPEHIWGDLSPDQLNFSDINIQAIGAGPYQIRKVEKNKLGIPTKIILKRNNNYSLGKPYLRTVVLSFFTTFEDAEKALKNNSVEALYGIPTSDLEAFAKKRSFTIHHPPLSRVFALFFNQNQQEIFLDKNVVEALDRAIPREAIIKRVFADYATVLCHPIPPFMVGYKPCSEAYALSSTEDHTAQALAILEKQGWKKDANGILKKDGKSLAFTLALPNNPELKETGAMIESALKDLGVIVTLQVFEPGNFDQDVIRPRAYEALLFGQIYEHDSDSFAFWHSSGRNDPGFNIGLYTNASADTLLRSILSEEDTTKREGLYTQLSKIFDDTPPAIFLYVPDFIYVMRSSPIHNVQLNHIISPSDRLSAIHTWYRYTDRVWKIFTRNN